MSLPVGVTNPMRASGGCAPVSLLEVLTARGDMYLWSEQTMTNTSSVLVGGPASYQDWIVGQPRFAIYGTTQTDTGEISIQNVSGNTVMRDISTAFSRSEFSGAFVYYRLWRADAEAAIFTFMGTVSDVAINEQEMHLHLESFTNWSAVQAPVYDIGDSCPLFFGSIACGSTAPTPCQNSYGTCSSIERFAGEVLQWDGPRDYVTTLVQIAQPAPRVEYNPARAF